jgi:hypothetical protein
MSIICEFCNKEFTNIGNLNVHLKKAKYCLIKRGIEIPKQTNESNCQYCCKLFASRQMCKIHERKCQNREWKSDLEEKDRLLNLKDQEILFLKQKLEEKTKEIDYFKEQIRSIALEGVRKPTNTATNITNILTPLNLNDEKIHTIIENHLDESYFLDAQKGVAKFCFDNLIKAENGKRRLICSDPVRERYRYIDDDGNVYEDIQARQFIEKVSKPIIEASKRVHDDLKDRYSQLKEDIKKGIEKGISDYLVDIKEKHAEQCLIDIHDIPFESRNKKFRKELAIRTRPPKTKDCKKSES